MSVRPPLSILSLAALLAGCAGGAVPALPPALLAPFSSSSTASPPAPPEPPRDLPGRFEVVGRGAVDWTRTTGLAVFRGADGRDYAYTGTYGACEGCVGNRMYAWDVTDPARPVLTDSVVVDAQRVNDVAVNAAGTVAVITRDGAVSRRNGIVVLDLADPAHPEVAADYWETLVGGAHHVWIEGSHAYVVDRGAAELAVLDLADPAAPREVGRWGIPYRPERFLQDVTVRDGLAYLAYWDDGVVVLDVGAGLKEASPSRPRLVSRLRYRTEWRGERYGRTGYAYAHVNRAGRRYVFVADHILPRGADLSRPVDTGGYLHVLDLSTPETPVEVATYQVPGSGVRRVWAGGDTLYVAAYGGGVRALDVSGELRGSLRGREVAALPTADERAMVRGFPFAWDVVTHNGLVFATDFNSGLWIARLEEGGGG
ncbi:MAG TPA: hypothetical protein VHG91_19050 [Longimicrobium sp.]|nr:hypothetical protein [Longimicrobium sp.]